MAGAAVKIAITADGRDASREFSKVGDAAEKSGSKFDGAADSAGNMASTSSQVAGGLGDLGGALSTIPGPLGALGTGMETAAPAIMGVTGAADLLEAGLGKMKLATIASKAATIAQTVATNAATVATRAFNLVMRMNPIGLVVTALFLLTTAVIAVVKHWDTIKAKMQVIWGFLKGAFTAAWNGIKTAISKAVNGAKAVVVSVFSAVLSFLRNYTLPGLIAKHWGQIKSTITGAVTSAKNWITDKFNAVVGFFGGVKSKIAAKVGGMFDGIKDAFRSAINWIIGKWNGLSFTLPSIDTKIPGIGKVGGFTLSTPNIPLMDTGGIVRGPGLVAVGNITEAMVPLSGPHAVKRGIGGGNVYKITVVAPVGSSSADIGRELVKHIDAFEGIGGRRSA